MKITDSPDGTREYAIRGLTVVETRTGQEVFSQTGRHEVILHPDGRYEIRPERELCRRRDHPALSYGAYHLHCRRHHRAECRCDGCRTDGVGACSEEEPCETCLGDGS